MNGPPLGHGPDLETLFALFPSDEDRPSCTPVRAADVLEPYRRLLVHEHHMTVTVEAFHGDRVNVRVLACRRDGDSYARKILLELRQSQRVVQFGIMRVNLGFCSPEVRREILAGQTPLGRVLIEHDVLRRIEPTAYLRVTPGRTMMEWFGLAEPMPTYGRLALIHCDGQPAVELLEIVAPA